MGCLLESYATKKSLSAAFPSGSHDSCDLSTRYALFGEILKLWGAWDVVVCVHPTLSQHTVLQTYSKLTKETEARSTSWARRQLSEDFRVT